MSEPSVPPIVPTPVGFIDVVRNLVAWTFMFVTCTVVASFVVPIGAVLRLFGPKPAEWWGDFTVNWWIRSLRFLYGVKIETSGLENIAANQNYVIVSPHRSHLDAVVIIVALFPKLRFGFMVKRALTRIPMWGWFIQLSGYLPVDRSKRGSKKRLDPLKAGVARLRAGRSVLVFPEGTRAKTHQFLQLRSGAFTLAQRSEVPILPVVVSGTGTLMPPTRLMIAPGAVRVEVLAPVEVKTGKRDQARREIAELLTRAYRLSPTSERAEEIGVHDKLLPPSPRAAA